MRPSVSSRKLERQGRWSRLSPAGATVCPPGGIYWSVADCGGTGACRHPVSARSMRGWDVFPSVCFWHKANRFCSRQTWGRQVAYASQFAGPDNRAHIGQAKIKSRLIADLDPDEWDLPPKPKRMRWRTYNRLVERFDRYEAILEDGISELMTKLLEK